MASPTPSKRATVEAEPVPAALPADALYEILLRMPAKEICRVRTVCRSWRALASDPHLADAHAARRRGAPPLLVVTFADEFSDEACGGVSIVDMSSGEVVKRVRTRDMDYAVHRTCLDLVCLVGGRDPMAVTALDPATGATRRPERHISEKYERLGNTIGLYMESCAFGKVPSTGQYKAFRFLGSRYTVDMLRQLCEVMTFDGNAQWRPMPGPPARVRWSKQMRNVAVDGVVYFLFVFQSRAWQNLPTAIRPGSVASFNLETEEWMGNISGPEPVSRYYEDGNPIIICRDSDVVEHLSLTDLDGSLVMVHCVLGFSMDLWFLLDAENSLWVRKFSISYRYENRSAYPFLLLDDERIVFIMRGSDVLLTYETKTDTYTDMMELEGLESIGLYTGNLLRLTCGFH